MPARWKTGLALLALAIAGPLRAGPVTAQAEPLTAQALIARCASQADAKLTGISALSKACPGVRAALDQLGLTAFLPPDWAKILTAGGLGDLGALAHRYAGATSSGAPGTASLQSIAARLVPPPPPPTWSERIGAWIRERIGPLLHQAGHRLRSLGPAAGRSALARSLLYGLIALLLTVVVVLLILELRGTGLLRRRGSAARSLRRSAVGARSTEPVEVEWREPDWARLRGEPARLLRLLVDILTRARRLERDRHLTCRELEAQARFDTDVERQGFARVVRLAERELYGPAGATVLADDVLHDAKALHAGLLAAAVEGGEIGQ